MGIGTWRPSEGCEGFTVECGGLGSDEVIDALKSSLAGAGFDVEMSSNNVIAKNEYLNITVTGWGHDIAVELQPNLSWNDDHFYDADNGFIIPIMDDRLLAALSETHSLLVNDLINGGYTPRYRTSDYTTSPYGADPDFNRDECIAALKSLQDTPSSATMFKEAVCGQHSDNYRTSLICQLGEQSDSNSGELGGMVAMLWKGEIYGIPLGMSGRNISDGDDIHVCHLKTLTDYLNTSETSFFDDMVAAHEPSDLPVVIDDPWIKQLEQTSATLRCEIDDLSTSRDIPLLAFLRKDEVAEVCDKEITLVGWDSEISIDPLKIDSPPYYLPFSHYSMLFDNGYVRDDEMRSELLNEYCLDIDLITLNIQALDDPLAGQSNDGHHQPIN